MGVRGTSSISFLAQIPSPRDSRCSSSAGGEKRIPLKCVFFRNGSLEGGGGGGSTHRHLLHVAVVVADRQPVELLLQLADSLVVEVTRRNEPVLVFLLQHFLEAALQELLLQQLLFHLVLKNKIITKHEKEQRIRNQSV